MSLKNVRPGAARQRPSVWSRLASQALMRLLSGVPAAPARSSSTRPPVVGFRKSAVCKDARGELRRIDLFLPVDLVGQLSRPLDIRFLDGDEPVTAGELGRALRSNFSKAEMNS